MSESESKSGISDDILAALTAKKIKRLQGERNALGELLRDTGIGEDATPEEIEKLLRQIDNRDGAAAKLNMYRADMLDQSGGSEE